MKYLCLSFLLWMPYLLSSQSIDSSAIKEIDSLIQVSRNLTEKNDFDKALEVNMVAEKLALEKFGKESDSYINFCKNQGRIFYYKENFKEAEKIWLDTKFLIEIVLGKDNADYSYILYSLAGLYSRLENIEKAEQFYLECISIQKNILGKEHLDYAKSLNNLGILYRKNGNYLSAIPLVIEANLIFEKKMGRQDPNYLGSKNNLANIYIGLGDYNKAEPILLEIKTLREKYFGKNHPDLIGSLLSLANLYYYLGDYEKQELFILEAKTICEKTLGKEHIFYATILTNLSNLYLGRSEYEKAELILIEAMSLVERTYGIESTDFALSLSTLSSLYSNLGNFEKAEEGLIQSKQIYEKILGKESYDFINSLINLGTLYFQTSNYVKAEHFFLYANMLIEETYGSDHPLYIESLNGLAIVNKEMKNFVKAEHYFITTKESYLKKFGKDHLHYATSLCNMGIFYNSFGYYKMAEDFALEAKLILERIVGKYHTYYIANLNNLATIYVNMENYVKAEALFEECSILNRGLLIKNLPYLSEIEIGNYVSLFKENEIIVSSIMQKFWKNIDLSKTLYNNTLFYKGLLININNQRSQFIFEDSSNIKIYHLLKTYKRRLNFEYAKPIAERKLVDELEEQSNSLEKVLIHNMKDLKNEIISIDCNEVQTILKTKEAAIEFVHYNYFDKNQTDSIMYAALVLLSNDITPHFVPLFEEKELNQLLSNSQSRRMDYVADVYRFANDNSDSLSLDRNKSLYELIWKPLEPYLKGVNKIYFSPSGLLHRINQNAIAINDRTLLSDQFELVQLGSTRQLVTNEVEKKSIILNACIYGGINFEMDRTALMATHHKIDTNGIALRSELSFSYTDSTLRGGTWKYLNGSEQEANDIKKIINNAGIKSNLFKGNEATEEAFKKLGDYKAESPQIIHISTHGYFFPDPERAISAKSGVSHDSAISKRTAKAASMIPNRSFGIEEPVFKISEHPMLRSGLIMAGANHAWKTGKPITPEAEDGILTAYEISQLNLRNTELVVLSACETGLGDIQGNEGVYGLQRAFKIAGVKNLIMSLWQVPDQQTSELMTAFYKYWLIKKKSIRESLKLAQNDLRKKGLESFYWAGFVLVE